MAEWIPPLQAVASCAWACGIAGALLPRLVPALVPATVYGRHFDDHSRTSSSPSSSAPSSGLPSSSSSSSSSSTATSFLAAAVSASRAWTVPKRFFTLFYLLGIAVAGAVLVVAWQGGYPAWSLVLLAAYTAHLLRRLLECIFVHRFSPDARMPVPLFLAGCAHYVLVPVSLLPACQGTLSSLLSLFGLPFLATLMGWGAGTTAANGPADGPQQPSSTVAGGPSSPISSSPSTAVDALALVRAVSAISLGMMLFVAGNIAQHFIHRKLAGLRDEVGDGAGAGGGATTAGDAPSSPSASRPQRRRRIGAEGAAADDDGGAAAPFMDVDLNGSSAPPSPARPRTAGASSSSSGQTSTLLYPPPRGGFFDYAVCPHYTAEIVIYVGLFVAQLGLGHVFGRLPPPPPCGAVGAGGEQVASPLLLSLARLGPLLLVAWVVTNLGVTGARTRKWYVDKYPREHRIRYTAAVIPWVW
jgi:hypothetical protein